MVVGLCGLAWIAIGYNQLPHAAGSPTGSAGWAFGVVLVAHVVGSALAGYLASGGNSVSVLVGGVVLSVLIEFTYDGSGEPISTYWIGVTANLLVFVSLGAVALTVGRVVRRCRHHPDLRALSERPRPPDSSGSDERWHS